MLSQLEQTVLELRAKGTPPKLLYAQSLYHNPR